MADIPTLDQLNSHGQDLLPGLIGVEFTKWEPGLIEASLKVRKQLLAPNGYLHAASVIALADTACGYGTATNLPNGATSFTTIELKTNFLGTAREGTINCVARLLHGGKTTQIWDAQVTNADTGATICLFRCTQLVIYKTAPQPAIEK